MTAQNRFRIGATLAFAFLGYVGAAVYCSYLIGLNWRTSLTCPLCGGCVLSVGDPFRKFVSRVMVDGTVNAILFIGVGWCLVGMARLAMRIANPLKRKRAQIDL